MPYFTLFAHNGLVFDLGLRTTHNERLLMLGDCENADLCTFGIVWNGEHHDDAMIMVDDLSVEKKLPLNTCLNRALELSDAPHNVAYIKQWGSIQVHGNAIVVTRKPLMFV